MVMRVAFRVDASLEMGSGHVMRCLTLADAMAAGGAKCLFVSRAHTGHLIHKIRERHRCIELPITTAESAHVRQDPGPGYSHWLGGTQEIDAVQTRDAMRDFDPNWLVVDHYAIGSDWEEYLQSANMPVFVIDDLADRKHICSVLLDQSLGRLPAEYQALVPGDCVTMAGPGFALLRDEFAAARSASLSRRSSGQIKNILVSMGGADAHNVTTAVLSALENSVLRPPCEVTVVLGQQNPWYTRVLALAGTLRLPTKVLVNHSEMANLMANADLAIGAGGGTSWERCCVGLPTVLLTLAENQIESAIALQKAGAVLHIDGWEHVNQTLPAAVDCLLDGNKLQAMSKAASLVCDGLGVQRVMEQLRRCAL